MRLLVLLTLSACSPAPPPTSAVVEAASSVEQSLDEAVVHHADGHVERARTAWRAARTTWIEAVEPGLQPALPHAERVDLTYRLALIRRELDADGGTPDAEVTRLKKDLQQALAKLP